MAVLFFIKHYTHWIVTSFRLAFLRNICIYVLYSLPQVIGSTIGDRVAVNHCVTEEIAKHLGKKLYELNCNLHPLDGVAVAARKILNSYDKEKVGYVPKSGDTLKLKHLTNDNYLNNPILRIVLSKCLISIPW